MFSSICSEFSAILKSHHYFCVENICIVRYEHVQIRKTTIFLSEYKIIPLGICGRHNYDVSCMRSTTHLC